MFANSNMMVRRLSSRAGREKLILGILQKKKGDGAFQVAKIHYCRVDLTGK